MNSSQLAISRSDVEFLTPTPITVLVVLAQLRHERREIRIAADDDERVDVRLGVAEVERVDDHPDVGGVLARLAHVRNLDQLERRLVHRRLERLVALPVAVGLLDDDAALEQQPLEHLADVELLVLGVAHAERDVLEIAEQRHVGDFGRMWAMAGRLAGCAGLAMPHDSTAPRVAARTRYTRPPESATIAIDDPADPVAAGDARARRAGREAAHACPTPIR